MLQYEKLDHKPASKLFSNLKGSYFEGSIYTVRNLVTNKLEDFHITNLYPFVYDLLNVDLRQVASIDQEIVDIDKITSHTGNPNKRAHMTCLT